MNENSRYLKRQGKISETRRPFEMKEKKTRTSREQEDWREDREEEKFEIKTRRNREESKSKHPTSSANLENVWNISIKHDFFGKNSRLISLLLNSVMSFKSNDVSVSKRKVKMRSFLLFDKQLHER